MGTMKKIEIKIEIICLFFLFFYIYNPLSPENIWETTNQLNLALRSTTSILCYSILLQCRSPHSEDLPPVVMCFLLLLEMIVCLLWYYGLYIHIYVHFYVFIYYYYYHALCALYILLLRIIIYHRHSMLTIQLSHMVTSQYWTMCIMTLKRAACDITILHNGYHDIRESCLWHHNTRQRVSWHYRELPMTSQY